MKGAKVIIVMLPFLLSTGAGKNGRRGRLRFRVDTFKDLQSVLNGSNVRCTGDWLWIADVY